MASDPIRAAYFRKPELAEALGVSERTVGLDWAMARSWLGRRMA